jgi:hypothetical protein
MMLLALICIVLGICGMYYANWRFERSVQVRLDRLEERNHRMNIRVGIIEKRSYWPNPNNAAKEGADFLDEEIDLIPEVE